MARPDMDALHRQLLRSLSDPSRRSPRGPYRCAYSEAQFERRLRDEAASSLPDDHASEPPLLADQLLHEQALELLDLLDLSERQRMIVEMKLAGHTHQEIAERLGIGARRVSHLVREIRSRLLARLRMPDETGSPYYGWQELYLASQRRRRIR